jgi:hypothetical protein
MKRQRIIRPPVLVAAAAILAACASGSVIVTGTKRAPLTSDQVQLYLEPPARFETIGLVSASSDAGWTEQGSVNYAIMELKRQAGKIGANGVLIGATGETTSTIVWGSSSGGVYSIPVTAKTVQGRAIYVESIE